MPKQDRLSSHTVEDPAIGRAGLKKAWKSVYTSQIKKSIFLSRKISIVLIFPIHSGSDWEGPGALWGCWVPLGLLEGL